MRVSPQGSGAALPQAVEAVAGAGPPAEAGPDARAGVGAGLGAEAAPGAGAGVGAGAAAAVLQEGIVEGFEMGGKTFCANSPR